MSRVDHVAKALDQAQTAEYANSLYTMQKATRLAQIHATLAVAEQVRIANLLTVATAEANLLDPLPEGHQYSPVFTAIREGLDI